MCILTFFFYRDKENFQRFFDSHPVYAEAEKHQTCINNFLQAYSKNQIKITLYNFLNVKLFASKLNAGT